MTSLWGDICPLQTKLLEQKIGHSLSMGNQQSNEDEGNPVRIQVDTICKYGDGISNVPLLSTLPPPLLTSLYEINYTRPPSKNFFSVHELLQNLKQANGGEQIMRVGDKLLVHLLHRATERKIAATVCEEEKNGALLELRTTELQLRTNEDTFKKNMQSLCQENEVMMEELDTMKVVYSLRKGMSRESEIRNKYEKQLSSIEDVLKKRESQLSGLQREHLLISASLTKTERERDKLLEKYHKLEERYKKDKGNTLISRASSCSQEIPGHMESDIFLHERASSFCSRATAPSLPNANN